MQHDLLHADCNDATLNIYIFMVKTISKSCTLNPDILPFIHRVYDQHHCAGDNGVTSKKVK